MLAFYEVGAFYRWHYAFLEFGWYENFVAVLLQGLLKQEDTIVSDQELQKVLFLRLEQASPIIRKATHLHNFSMIISRSQIAFGPIDNNIDSILNILKSLKRLQ